MYQCTYHRIGIWQKLPQQIQKSLVFHKLSIYVMHLCNTDSCCFAHIWVFILQTLSQWLTQVLSDFIYTYTAHCTHCKCSNQRVRIITILEKTSGMWPTSLQDKDQTFQQNNIYYSYFLRKFLLIWDQVTHQSWVLLLNIKYY